MLRNSDYYRYSSRTINPVLTDDQIRRVAPSVFAEAAHESRSDRYRFFPTFEVLDGLRNNGFLPVRAQQSTTRIEDRREHTRHLIRFRHESFLQGHHNVGDEIPEVVLLNSHDGTSSYQLMAGVFRLVCTNGLVVGDKQFDMKVRHSGTRSIVDDVIDASFRVVDSFPAAMEQVEEMKNVPVTRNQALAYANAALSMRWGNSDGTVEAPIEPEGLIQRRRYNEQPDTVWTAYNVVQENLIRGGVRGRTKTNRRMSTRAINSVNEDVRLNRALWVLANELKAAVA